MNEDFANRVAVVVGGSGGIGSAISRAFLERDSKIVVLDRESPDFDAPWISTDLGDEDSVCRAIEGAASQHGRIDYLIHGAGITRDGVVWKVPSKDWDEVLSVNLRSAYLLMREAIPIMRKEGFGRIVLVGSINGLRGKFGQTAYAASKAGLVGLAKSAAREAARFGIHVNVLEPGMVETAMTEKLPDEVVQAAKAECLLSTLAKPGDIANAVLFLCGEGARHMTGQILRVDGGQYL